MSENFNSHIACEGTDNDINWVCKVCKDLPNYAGMYLYQREREKNQLKNVKDRRADLILLKYYCSNNVIIVNILVQFLGDASYWSMVLN